MPQCDRRRFASRFDAGDAQDPVTSLGNLVDVMLVVVCGLAAALVAAGKATTTQAIEARGEPQRTIVRGREIPRPPTTTGRGGAGYEPVGRVFRDPRTGALVLVDEAPDAEASTPR